MPMLIEHIDKIAREKKRGVLFINFPHYRYSEDINISSFKDGVPDIFFREFDVDDATEDFDGREYKPRLDFLEYLEANGIAYKSAGHFARETGWSSWNGLTYIDIPYDENNEDYKKVCSYLENKDGTPKDIYMVFFYLPLEKAMKNVHHDMPGFWDKWAENF
jgi:hypothetical protein